MQHVVSEIFKALGGVTAVANGLNAPVQTVDSWMGKGRLKGNAKASIPAWRRPEVLRLASDTGKLAALSPDALEYLQQGKAA